MRRMRSWEEGRGEVGQQLYKITDIFMPPLPLGGALSDDDV